MLRISFLLIFIMAVITLNCKASSGGVPLSEEKKPQVITPAKPKAVSKAKPVPPKPIVKPIVSKKESLELKRERAIIAKKRQALNNTEWDIKMLPLSGKGREIKDIVVFSENKVFLKKLKEKGFSATNYTLSLQDNGKTVWETMQTKEDETVFFRGELSSDLENMSGVISFQELEGNKDYSFKSIAKRKIPIKK